jgi:addiction module RelE/StbE family toxin
MAFRVVWSQRAVHDLEAIADFIADDSPAYASIVVRNIVNRIRTLSQFPRSGRKASEFDDENIRELVVYSYRIIYQVLSEQVLIAAVIHGKCILQ